MLSVASCFFLSAETEKKTTMDRRSCRICKSATAVVNHGWAKDFPEYCRRCAEHFVHHQDIPHTLHEHNKNAKLERRPPIRAPKRMDLFCEVPGCIRKGTHTRQHLILPKLIQQLKQRAARLQASRDTGGGAAVSAMLMDTSNQGQATTRGQRQKQQLAVDTDQDPIFDPFQHQQGEGSYKAFVRNILGQQKAQQHKPQRKKQGQDMPL